MIESEPVAILIPQAANLYRPMSDLSTIRLYSGAFDADKTVELLSEVFLTRNPKGGLMHMWASGQEEVFGRVPALMRDADEGHAVKVASSTPYGLSGHSFRS